MEGLGRMDKAFGGGSIFFLFRLRTIPFIDEPPTFAYNASRHVLPSPHAPRTRIMQANPHPSASRLSSSLDHPHLKHSPIQLAYHQVSPSRWWTVPRPRIYAKRGIHRRALTTIGSLPPDCLWVYTHQAASGISLPSYYNRVHALIRRERNRFSHPRQGICSSGLTGA
jgi:hypothetical protein